MTVLRVRGGTPLNGSAPLPGDKSISHRVLLLSALADGPTVVRNLSPCGDVARTLAALLALGVRIDGQAAGNLPATEDQEGELATGAALTDAALAEAALAEAPPGIVMPPVTVHGRGARGLGGRPVRIECGESGTTMRLLAGVLSSQDREFELDGSPALRGRPMDRVVEPLRTMGASIETAPGGRPPIVGRGSPLAGQRVELLRASAQAGGAVLLAGLGAEGTTAVVYPAPVRDHTERMLTDMDVAVSWDGETSSLSGPVDRLRRWSGGDGIVPGDFSAASFLLGAAAMVQGSTVHLSNVGTNGGRTGLIDVLASMGGSPRISHEAESGGEPLASLAITSADLTGTEVGAPTASRAIDELPLVAVLATQARGRTTVRDAAELRVKECDRIAAIVDGLSRLGADIEERDDGFSVVGPTRLSGTLVEGYGDHRIVMALAVAGLAAEGETIVTDGACVADSFPGFVPALCALGADIRETAS